MYGTPFTYEVKCWGEVAHLFASDHAAVSHLRVVEKSRCSQHRHHERANRFVSLSATLLIEEWDGPDQRMTILRPGQTHTVPSGILHRFRVLKSGEVVEVYWPDNGGVVRLDDIERLDQGGVDP